MEILFYFSVPEYEVVHIHSHVRRRSTENNPNLVNSIHETNSKYTKTKGNNEFTNLKLKAFGEHLDLNLRKNSGLFKKTGLKIWTVESNDTAQHGVEYVEIPEVT